MAAYDWFLAFSPGLASHGSHIPLAHWVCNIHALTLEYVALCDVPTRHFLGAALGIAPPSPSSAIVLGVLHLARHSFEALSGRIMILS